MQTIDPVEELFAEAKKHDIPMSRVCDRAKVARSTPSRWRNKHYGATINTLDHLRVALRELIAERAA